MTTISAKPILLSQHAQTGQKIATILARYPRWIHAEGRTHRLVKIAEGEDLFWAPTTPSLMEDENLSRNASSSRAIPVKKLIQDVLDDPAIPLFWGKNQKGMQADEECDASVILPSTVDYKPTSFSRENAWLEALQHTVRLARAFDEAGYHKQIVNRLLEPFSHITVVVTATNWSNFLALRDHTDAEPHIAMLAREVRKALDGAYQVLQPGEWHLPFVPQGAGAEPWAGSNAIIDAIKLSVARCASTSYKTVEGFDMTMERAIALHDKLVAATPLHASPCEHVCQADEWLRDAQHDGFRDIGGWANPQEHGNFVGFRQYRKMLPGECL